MQTISRLRLDHEPRFIKLLLSAVMSEANRRTSYIPARNFDDMDAFETSAPVPISYLVYTESKAVWHIVIGADKAEIADSGDTG